MNADSTLESALIINNQEMIDSRGFHEMRNFTGQPMPINGFRLPAHHVVNLDISNIDAL
jgi:hypothetical protein